MQPETETEELRREIARLADEMAELNGHRYIRVHNNVARLMFFQFLRGLMLGLGTAVGATALVSVAVLVLSQIEFIPILGDLATALIQEIQEEVAE